MRRRRDQGAVVKAHLVEEVGHGRPRTGKSAGRGLEVSPTVPSRDHHAGVGEDPAASKAPSSSRARVTMRTARIRPNGGRHPCRGVER